MSKRALIVAFSLLSASSFSQHAQAQVDEHFDINRFAIEGNTLLSAANVEALVAPYSGKHKVYGDVQHALEALENAYRAAGYGTVHVHVPEQELTGGVVRLVVSEGVLGKVTVVGNRHFSEANVRASLPALKEGAVPNVRVLSENIQLSNENPAKRIDVTLGVGQGANKIDGKVAVTEENPQKFFMTLDNTGNPASGRSRFGLAYQNANLFDLDHVLTLAYTTSLDKPEDVKVDIFSAAYRLPLYNLGDSVDVVVGKSNVDTPSVQATGFGLSGKGEVASVRYNHYFPRAGEYSSRLTFGFDYKYFDNTCRYGGAPYSAGACTPYTTRPISATYAGEWLGAGVLANYHVDLYYNLPLGATYPNGSGGSDRYSYIANRKSADDHFSILRFGGSYMATVFSTWQARVAVAGQYASDGLVPGEQISLAGVNAVRGFGERAVTADSGHVVNLEVYSPELANDLSISGNLRGVLFYDFARGHNSDVLAPPPATNVGIASAGVGLRYNMQKDLTIRVDLAEVQKAGPTGTEGRGDWFGHVNMMYSF